MPFKAGDNLGSFEILQPIGSGGFGAVYKARDTRLNRTVAIKVLSEHISSNTEARQRFEREAQTIASLKHPNICVLHDIGKQDGAAFLVMEFIEGETLSHRLTRGPLPLNEALKVAIEIADALDKAHRQRITHRDLKPGNIMLTKSGSKLLDFGLAKLKTSPTADRQISSLPTGGGAADLTAQGMIIGTLQYMSPEQLEGIEADARSDIFAFGAVLYEMLTGRKAFEGRSQSSLIAAIMHVEPPEISALQPMTPPSLERVVKMCLAKDPEDRWQSAHDLYSELRWIADGGFQSTILTPAVAPGAGRNRLPWAVAAVLAIMALALAGVALRPVPETREMRLEINTPATSQPLEFALSPDGRYIVFVASGDGPQRLWLRALDRTDAAPITGTEGARYPFWSPDSRSIGFSTQGNLKRVDIAGGSPQTLSNTLGGYGGAWNVDNTIIFAAGISSPLSRIAASGGEPAAVTKLDRPRQTAHWHPQFLPDGRHFLYYPVGSSEASGIYLGSLDGEPPKRLAAADTAAIYMAPGFLVFVRQNALMAQRFDVKRGELTGDPAVVAESVGEIQYAGAFSVSTDGKLAYRSSGASLRQLSWFDRTGKAVGVAGEPDSEAPFGPELSSDGQRVAIWRAVQNNVDIWLMDLVRGGMNGANASPIGRSDVRMTRFTFDTAVDFVPVWSPDGGRIAFSSSRKGVRNLYVKSANGAGVEEPLLETPNDKNPQDWSRDGRFLLYSDSDPKTSSNLWALPVSGEDRKPIAVGNTAFDELNGQFSPDGRWVAYETNESGRFEIVVQAFPNPGSKWQVSTGGGVQPRWRADGKELYFIAPDGKLMAASIAVTGSTLQARTPVVLFSTRLASSATGRQQYAVSRDGRCLLNQVLESSGTPITLILNWKPKAER